MSRGLNPRDGRGSTGELPPSQLRTTRRSRFWNKKHKVVNLPVPDNKVATPGVDREVAGDPGWHAGYSEYSASAARYLSRVVPTVTTASASYGRRTYVINASRKRTGELQRWLPRLWMPPFIRARSSLTATASNDVITHGERKWTYLASDMKAGGHRQVALAVMEPGPASSASQREVEMMGKVGPHDCIVTLHDFDLDAPSPYLVYEYLPGHRLRDHCRDLQARGSQVPLADFFRHSPAAVRGACSCP